MIVGSLTRTIVHLRTYAYNAESLCAMNYNISEIYTSNSINFDANNQMYLYNVQTCYDTESE